jgi:hypothetical protein
MRSRNFVRTLSPREIAELRAKVRQINCSNCGGPLNLEKDVACSYCRAPISWLDPGQVAAALAELEAADARRQKIDPALPLALLAARVESARACAGDDPGNAFWTLSTRSGSGLVEAGLEGLMRWLSSTTR